VRLAWLRSYARRLCKLTPAEQKAAGFLFDSAQVQAAIDLVSQE
jgi:hypothetical protein